MTKDNLIAFIVQGCPGGILSIIYLMKFLSKRRRAKFCMKMRASRHCPNKSQHVEFIILPNMTRTWIIEIMNNALFIETLQLLFELYT